jgi:hypothetical protein
MIPARLQTAIDEAKAVGSRAVPITFDELALIIEAAKAEGRAEARQAIPAPWLWATGPSVGPDDHGHQTDEERACTAR